ncbi:cupredoxin domain-containing protein [Alcanivorax sp. DP30]|uniref:cupredoxin domain-containing protein n=1 Tax=Alcanivorax sp. DP30 TaxID=2606217 RepID=UPI0013682E80|nr:cupredoxin domain-containing protein [Alcanivorax sp. DP30]MZR64496.1 cupredoxin domain-containing protein [Alcanivorax sp. DP30]
MSILINLSGIILAGLIVWWFWLSKPDKRKRPDVTGETTVIVENGVYQPGVIHARAGQPLTLHFDRRDPSPCAEQVIFHGLEASEFLDNGKVTTVTLSNPPRGEYRFTCQMQMYQGRLIVD